MKWDQYFLDGCNWVATNSKCLSRKVGAIIVTDKSIISTGYNGPPRSVPSCNWRYNIDSKLRKELIERKLIDTDVCKNQEVKICPRQMLGYKSGEGLEWCVAGHAERNALINAARHGISVKGATMYMNCGRSCTPCLIEIINAGIVEIVISNKTEYDLMGSYLINESKLKVREYIL
jgi:dCMP deaminase